MAPSPPLLDELRYLRQLGVPFTEAELGGGRGNRITYGYDHLIETGVAHFGMQRGMRPREIATYLVEHRNRLHLTYRKALREQPEGATEAEWVKSRGRLIPLLEDEIFLRLPDRQSETPGKFEVLEQHELQSILQIGMLAERFPGEETRTLVPLTRLVLQLVAWAKEAPEIRPGRK
jgi:hypothetical protein